ncbi:MAG: DsbA family protein [Myxococcota bacterium]
MRWSGVLMLALVGMLSSMGAGCRTQTQDEARPGVRIDAERHRVEIWDDDYALGGEQPLVTVVVFTDYACPPCARTWQVMDHLVEDYGADLRVVYRAFTVPGFGRGEQAAEAAYAAGAQGKFWEMHRRLFEQGGNFDRPTLRAHAEALSLDIPRFLDDLDTGTHSSRRMRHRRQAKTLGVMGLPASFVNGLYLAGFADEATWHGVIDEEIRRAREQIAQGTPRAEVYTTFMKAASTKPVGAGPGEKKLREKLAAQSASSPAPRKLVAPDPAQRYAVRVGELPASGDADAPVELVMFFDFRCPYCRRAWQQELGVFLRSQPRGFRVAVRHMPLEIHPEARGAALAVLAAARQGKQWGMFEKVITHEGPLGRSNFAEYAEALGLDRKRLLADLDEPALEQQLAADLALAQRVGVTGTPAFFINGRYVSGYSPGVITNMLEQELAVAQAKIDAGTPREQVVDAVMADAIPESEFPNR